MHRRNERNGRRLPGRSGAHCAEVEQPAAPGTSIALRPVGTG